MTLWKWLNKLKYKFGLQRPLRCGRCSANCGHSPNQFIGEIHKN